MGDKNFSKDDAYKTLDTINMWINNCDTKASIVLGSIGVVATIFLSSDFVHPIKNIIEKSFSNLIWPNSLYCIVLIIGIILCVIGICFFVSCITPKIILSISSSTIKRLRSCGLYKKLPEKCKERIKKLFSFFKKRKTQKTNNESDAENSIMFYGKIALKDYNDYVAEVKNASENFDHIMQDLTFQIHTAACICNSKFRKFKKGIFCFSTGIIICVILLAIGYYFL